MGLRNEYVLHFTLKIFSSKMETDIGDMILRKIREIRAEMEEIIVISDNKEDDDEVQIIEQPKIIIVILDDEEEKRRSEAAERKLIEEIIRDIEIGNQLI